MKKYLLIIKPLMHNVPKWSDTLNILHQMLQNGRDTLKILQQMLQDF